MNSDQRGQKPKQSPMTKAGDWGIGAGQVGQGLSAGPDESGHYKPTAAFCRVSPVCFYGIILVGDRMPWQAVGQAAVDAVGWGAVADAA